MNRVGQTSRASRTSRAGSAFLSFCAILKRMGEHDPGLKASLRPVVEWMKKQRRGRGAKGGGAG